MQKPHAHPALVFGEDKIISYTVDVRTQDLQLYWKDEHGHPLKSVANLKTYLAYKNRTLVFAGNGGMYKTDRSPVGLFIQNGQTLVPLDTTSGTGNFYLKPNGVFYVTDTKQAGIGTTPDFKKDGHIRFATQSGPMLLINGNIHPAFKAGSTNVNIRNGVGILADGRVLFAMSKESINFYDFAVYFQQAGCKNALYLDGFVSRMYLPEKNWIQTDGDFGVMVGVSVPKK